MTEEKNLDFDTVIDRHGTDSLKFDCAEKRGLPADVLPLWVADMDFRTSSRILDALKDRTDHGIFGYTEAGESYFEAVHDWMKERHGWDVREEWLTETPGVVFALANAVRAFTAEGDAVLIQQPVYYPFSEVIKDNGRKIVSSDLVKGSGGKYTIDLDDFEKKVTENDVRLFILCSPHNPVGRVWTREELEKVGDICINHGVTIVSDEIHEDFILKGTFTPFASIKQEFLENSVICTSPAKTFNLSGLQVSNIFIENEELRKKFRKEVWSAGYSQIGTLGLTAGEAAYRYGGEWYEKMLSYISSNIDFMKKYIDEYLPEIKMTEPEGTYLVWLDCSGLGLGVEELDDFIIHKAKLWLDSGKIFGKPGEGFQRVNAACPRATLKEGLDRLRKAVEELRAEA
jgi:cystathionine beta-lyase